MEIRLTGRHVELTDELRSFINEKVGKLERFYDRIHEVEVIVSDESEQVEIEIIVRAGHKQTFIAKETGPEAPGLVDVIVDKLERQIKKYKEKNRNHKGGTPADGREL